MKASDIVSLLQKIINSAIDSLKDRTVTDKVGKELVDDIRKRTRLGYGCSIIGGVRQPLKGLSPSYKEFRKGKLVFFKDKKQRIRVISKKSSGRHSQLSEFTTPTKSNLTFTAQLLDNMKSKTTSKGVFDIHFVGNHRPLSKNGKTITNAELAGYVQKDRPFIYPTDREIQRLEKSLYDKVKDELTKNIKKLVK